MTGLEVVGRLAGSPAGVLKFEPGRDLREVVALLELGFQDDLQARDRRWLADLGRLSGMGPLLSAFSWIFPVLDSGFTGFVFYERDRLVGNVSIMRSASDVWLIANVVTHPDCRRQGIARRLVEAALAAARERGGRQVQLQVRDDNVGARALYEAFGFDRRSATTTLLRAAGDPPPAFSAAGLSAAGGRITVRPWEPKDARRARRLLARAGELEAGSSGPVRQAVGAGTLAARLSAAVRGLRRVVWVAAGGGDLRAIAAAQAVGAGPHALEVVADPAWVGRTEAALVGGLLADPSGPANAEVRAEISARQTGALAALEAAGFERQRTLDRLVLDL